VKNIVARLFLVAGAGLCLVSCVQPDADKRPPGNDPNSSTPHTNAIQPLTKRVEVVTTGTNELSVKLIVPDAPLALQATNFGIQLVSTNSIKANLIATNVPLTILNTNLSITVALKFDSALTNIFPSTISITSPPIQLDFLRFPSNLFPSLITVTSAPIRLEGGSLNGNVQAYEMNTNSQGSWSRIAPEIHDNKCFPFFVLGICIVLGGLLGRSAAIAIEQLNPQRTPTSTNAADVKGMLLVAFLSVCGVLMAGSCMFTTGGSRLTTFWIPLTFICLSIVLLYHRSKKTGNWKERYKRLFFEAICGVVGAALVPIFSRLVSRDLLITSTESAFATISLFSFCLLAGMLGLEFIRGVMDVWRGVVFRLSDQSTKDCKEREKALEAEGPAKPTPTPLHYPRSPGCC
jgi:hypothetical protein